MATITGTSGNDSLVGTSSQDSLSGLEGNDTLDGASANDFLDGGPGDDTFVIGAGYFQPRLADLGQGADVVRFKVQAGEMRWIRDHVIQIVELNPTWTVVGYRWQREIALEGTTFTLESENVRGGGLTLVQFEGTGLLQVVNGTARTMAAAELLAGMSDAEVLDGGDGNDVLFGNGGRDTLLGGAGDDMVGAGNDNEGGEWLDGGTGIDMVSFAGYGDSWNTWQAGLTIDLALSTAGTAFWVTQVFNFEGATGSPHKDTLIGRDGAGDTLDGYFGQDTLYGGSLDDVLLGGGGDDVLYGEEDDDALDGGAGHDTLYGADGYNTLAGGDGHDLLVAAGTADTLEGGGGNDTLTLGGSHALVVIGASAGNDTVSGFTAGGSDDVLVFRGTPFATLADVLAATSDDGGDALVRISARASVRIVGVTKAQLTAADIVVEAPASTPAVPVPAEITGTAGDDTLIGSSAQDTISGLAGNDWIDGKGGSDQITSGTGNDHIVVGLGYGSLSFSELTGWDDTLVLDAPLEDLAWVKDDFISYAPYLPDWDYFRNWRLTDDTTIFENRRSGGDLIYLRTQDHGLVKFEFRNRDIANILPGEDDAERLDAGLGDDIVFGNGGADVLLGGAGDDYLAVGNDDTRADWLDGGDGIDTVSYTGASGSGVIIDIGRSYATGAHVGSDQVFNFEAAIGSAGHDVLIGRDGAGDTLKGYWGNDWLYAGGADDVLYGQHGNDVLLGEAGGDTLDGGEGDDWLYGGSGSNSIAGGGGVDVLISQGANDTLAGGDGGDYVYAFGTGLTQAAGGAGNDIFVMQQGPSYANGGDGQDYFYMGASSDTMLGGAGMDVLLGGGGYDVFDGGADTDYLFLGAGGSTVVFHGYSGADVVNGFKAEGSRHGIRFEGTRFTTIDDILAATYDFNGDALIRLDSDTVVWLVGVGKAQLSAADFAIA